jgi:hypothetical protein
MEMEPGLRIKGLFESDEDLRSVVKKRKVCYDTEPFYISDRKVGLLQIGFRINLYGTFPGDSGEASPDSPDYAEVERDVRRLAEALSDSCDPLHMCESTTIEPAAISYSPERKMRPDVTVHVPVFDQKHFGHPVDDAVRNALREAVRLLESAGVQKSRWQD